MARTTVQRGYGYAHKRARALALKDLKANPGQPCHLCGRPMYAVQQLDYDHTVDRTGYRGLTHAFCNRQDGGRRAHWPRRRRTEPPPSRAW